MDAPKFYGDKLVSGVCSTHFLKAYDPTTKVFDKSRTSSPVKDLYVLTLTLGEFEVGLVRMEELLFDSWECLIHPEVPREGAVNLSSAARYAARRAQDHGGEPLLILMRYPELLIGGIDYRFETPFGEISEIKPGVVTIEKVFGIYGLRVQEKADPRPGSVLSFRLREITDRFS